MRKIFAKFIQIPFLEKIARQACCKGSVNIALAVSDEEGAFPQKGVVRKSLQDHAWLGFTARTWMYQFLDGPFRRVVGTVIEMGNLTAGFFYFLCHESMKDLHVLYGVVSSCNPALVGYDKDGIPQLMEPCQGRFGAGNPLDLLWTADISRVHIKDTVTVKKYGFLSHSHPP